MFQYRTLLLVAGASYPKQWELCIPHSMAKGGLLPMLWKCGYLFFFLGSECTSAPVTHPGGQQCVSQCQRSWYQLKIWVQILPFLSISVFYFPILKFLELLCRVKWLNKNLWFFMTTETWYLQQNKLQMPTKKNFCISALFFKNTVLLSNGENLLSK